MYTCSLPVRPSEKNRNCCKNGTFRRDTHIDCLCYCNVAEPAGHGDVSRWRTPFEINYAILGRCTDINTRRIQRKCNSSWRFARISAERGFALSISVCTLSVPGIVFTPLWSIRSATNWLELTAGHIPLTFLCVRSRLPSNKCWLINRRTIIPYEWDINFQHFYGIDTPLTCTDCVRR